MNANRKLFVEQVPHDKSDIWKVDRSVSDGDSRLLDCRVSIGKCMTAASQGRLFLQSF